MTARQVFEGLLVELTKVNAPSMLLDDFNYFINKAVNQYINKRYNIYDINQQTSDDIRVLKSTAILKPYKFSLSNPDIFNSETDFDLTTLQNLSAGNAKIFDATYEVNLPLDYLHLLNCTCIYKLNENWKCYNEGDNVQFAAKRLTADSWSIIMNDYYNRPLPHRPYYYIHNVNKSINLPTNSITPIPAVLEDGSEESLTSETSGTDISGLYNYTVNPNDSDNSKPNTGTSNLPRTLNLKNLDKKVSTVEREAGVRYGNPTNVRMEIRYGHDSSVFELIGVFVDYIKAPLTIRLTLELVNLTRDTSLIMEFPDYVCLEIINELVNLVMENTADPRLQTHATVTESIATPAQQLAQPQPQQQKRG